MTAQRAHTTPISPFRRGLADMMTATEQRARAYDTLLGTTQAYDRLTAMRGIFKSGAVLDLPPPGFPANVVKLSIAILITETVIAQLFSAREFCQRRLAQGAPQHQAVYRLLIKDIDAAIEGERRIRNEQIALQRMKT